MRADGVRRFPSRRMPAGLMLALGVLSMLVLPASIAEAQVGQGTGGTTDAAVAHCRELLVVVTAGEEFPVTVRFMAPVDGFHAIGLTEVVPAGWKASVDVAWTEPQAILARTPEPEEAVYIWMGPFAAGVEFTAVYWVSVPANVVAGNYAFGGSLEYYIEPFPAPSHWGRPSGDVQVRAVDAAGANTVKVAGVIREVDGSVLPGASVVLYRSGRAVAHALSDGNGEYTLAVPGLGDYRIVASKKGFRDEASSLPVTSSARLSLDFARDRGLIPDAPDRPYVLACASLWQLDDPALQLSTARLLDVISASKYPLA